VAKSSTTESRQPNSQLPADSDNGPATTVEGLLDRLRRKQPENYYFSAEFTEALIKHMALAKRKALTPSDE